MTYIFTALKPEAQAFVDKYKLQKSRLNNFTIFSNSEILLIISGLGVKNMQDACSFILSNYPVLPTDIYINIGICASDKKYLIGELIEIGKIRYENLLYTLNENINTTINCQDTQATKSKYSLVDMESFGFYKVLGEQKNSYIFKVVSDHFEPDKITKESSKKLIFNIVDDIFEKVKQ